MAKCLLSGLFLLLFLERTAATVDGADDTSTSCCTAQVNDLKQRIGNKDTSIKNLLSQNSELENNIMQLKDDLLNVSSVHEQCEKRLVLSDKRYAQKKKEFSDCRDKILEFGPEDANAAQQEIWFLRKQVNEFKESLKTKDDEHNKLKVLHGDMRVDRAVCGKEQQNIEKQHGECENIKKALAHEKSLNQDAIHGRTLWVVILVSVFVTMGCAQVYKFLSGDQEQKQRKQEHDEMIQELQQWKKQHDELIEEQKQWKQEHDELIHLKAIFQALEIKKAQLGQHEKPAIGQNDEAGQNEQAPEEQGGGGENEGDLPHSINTPPIQVAPPQKSNVM